MTGPFLGVERSVTGRRWRARALGDDRLTLQLAQRLGVPELIARLLAARDIGAEEADRFLKPTLRDWLPDPCHLLDMERAVERLARAVRGGELIAVFGDYDVDGATSSALLHRFFHAVGGRVRVYIPDRLTEGYGPNAPALLKLKGEGASVAVTVDCGTTAFAALAAAKKAGLDVVVIDHHTAEPELPEVLALVNPNRLDESSPHRTLAAVGVAFLLVVGLNRALRKAGWFASRPEPDPLAWLDLVALGTVCDVVPLVGLNRALVAQGLKVLRRRGNTGLAALADVARLATAPEAYHLGFLLGPRVNAGGRVGRADLGARLLACDDPGKAKAIAAELDRFNAERQAIEAIVLERAMAKAAESAGDPVLVIGAEGWHAGVIGIVASRIKDHFNRPCCVVSLDQGTGKGSGRSIPGVALGPAVIAARQAGLLINGGGHAMAAGFTVEAGRLADLRRFLNEHLAPQLGALDPRPSLGLDGALAPGAATPELVDLIQAVGPFGAGNAEPRFALAGVKVVKVDVVGEKHVSCVLAGSDGSRLRGIAFRSLENGLGTALLQARGSALHVAGKLRLDTWNGRRQTQLHVDDAAPAG
ncbi:MAG: single-stranded-DNA-specific exonuclease RecJ [Alphaproteobacteria bacterium]|nr:single-stranded-DNA-specific exonuclease RecJ [Alphaproteobacteria bacterium]